MPFVEKLSADMKASLISDFRAGVKTKRLAVLYGPCSTIYEVVISGFSASSLVKILYKDSTVALTRKAAKAKTILEGNYVSNSKL